MGSKASSVVAVVIKHGRMRFSPASSTDWCTSLISLGAIAIKGLCQIGGHNDTVICGYSKRAINPTQTATLKLIVRI